MTTKNRTGNDELQSIAHEAMLERGLLPDFSAAVIAETNQITQAQVAGVAADRIDVTESGPAAGAIFLVLEHQGNTIVIEKGPGSAYTAEFQRILGSFAFAAASG